MKSAQIIVILFFLMLSPAIGQEVEVYDLHTSLRITLENSVVYFSLYDGENDEYSEEEYPFSIETYRDFQIMHTSESSFVKIQSENILFLLSPDGESYRGFKRRPEDRAPTEGNYFTLGSIESSSSLIEHHGSETIEYSPERLLDFDISSGWVEGVEGVGIGETLRFSLRYKSIGSSLFFYNGFLSPADLSLYYQNARLKDFTIKVDSGNVYEFQLNDSPNEQVIYLPEKSHSFVLEVKSVYPGDQYQDLAISGIFANFRPDYYEVKF